MEPMNLSTPGVFANARVDPDELEDPGGLKCELITYEARYNSVGDRITLQAGTRRVEKKVKERNHNSAFVLTRYYRRDKELDYTELQVRSPHVRAALRAVVKTYPGLSFDTGKIIIRDEPKCLFHYRNELREYGVTLDDQVAVEHLVFILNYMYRTLESEIASYYTFMESPSITPGIEYKNLWMAFRPGDFIYAKVNGSEKIVRLKSTSRAWFRCVLTAEEIQYDGADFGYRNTSLSISEYTGYKPLESLSAYPLQYHPHKEAITKSLIARGKKFIGLRGIQPRFYEGVANSLSPFRINGLDGEEDEYPIQSIMVRHTLLHLRPG
jgi:hypothetical protein